MPSGGQLEALLDGGVDLILFETIIDTLNAKAALFAAEQLKSERNIQTPIMVSGTITDASGRTLSGQTTEAFLISISHCELFSVGLNCAFGAEMMRPFLKILSEKSDFMVSAYPNAGLPNEFGHYDETPEEMVEQIIPYFEDEMVNIIGGCCGTTPDHIKAIATLAKKIIDLDKLNMSTKLHQAIDKSILKAIPNPSKEAYEIKIKIPEFTFLGYKNNQILLMSILLFIQREKLLN